MSPSKQKPPPSVITVVVLYSIAAAIFLLYTIGVVIYSIVDQRTDLLGYALLTFVIALLPTMEAQGLWRGYRGARILAMISGVLALPSGLLILILLTRPAAKEWFGVRAAPRVHFPPAEG